MKKIILTVGTIASGKSTWAKEEVRKAPDKITRVSRDDLRNMMSNYSFTQENENLVTSVRDHTIVAALKRDRDVIVDETGLNKRHFKDMIKLARKSGVDCQVIEKHFYVDLNTSLDRNSKREGTARIPEDIVKKFWKRAGGVSFKHYNPKTETVLANSSLELDSEFAKEINNPSLPKCILVDLDGTISLFNVERDKDTIIRHPQAHTRSPYNAINCNEDLPNEAVVEVVNKFYNDNYKIIFCSGREDQYEKQTREFLSTYLNSNVEYSLFMRKTNDYRKDNLIKEEILRNNILGKYRVMFALDDRNMMVDHYRNKLGINTFQVNYGDF